MSVKTKIRPIEEEREEAIKHLMSLELDNGQKLGDYIKNVHELHNISLHTIAGYAAIYYRMRITGSIGTIVEVKKGRKFKEV